MNDSFSESTSPISCSNATLTCFPLSQRKRKVSALSFACDQSNLESRPISIDIAKENDQDCTISMIVQLVTGKSVGDLQIQSCVVLKIDISTHPAEATTISCLFALVKAEIAAEKIMVKANTRIIISGVFEMVPSIEALKSIQIGTIKRPRTTIVMIIVTQYEIRVRSQ